MISSSKYVQSSCPKYLGGVLLLVETIETELIYADVSTVEKAEQRMSKLSKSGDKKVLSAIEMLKALMNHLQGLKPARSFDLSKWSDDLSETANVFRDLHLITAKPQLYVCNVDEDLASADGDNAYTQRVRSRAAEEGAQVLLICGKLEEELSQLDAESKEEMLKDLGMHESGLDRLILKGYDALGLMTYFTAGEKELRAWTIHRGDKAPQAAGKIHSDFERGFICAEVYKIEDLEQWQSKAKLKEQGLLRQEGRDYVVQDADVMEFRFNV